jgi:hypothetical protein
VQLERESLRAAFVGELMVMHLVSDRDLMTQDVTADSQIVEELASIGILAFFLGP